MGIHSYYVGHVARIGNHSTNDEAEAFTDAATGAATDPSGVTLKVVEPDGDTTTYTYLGSPALSKETTGRYYVDVQLTGAGMWSYRLAGTGSAQAAFEGQLHVRKSVTG